MAMQLWNGVSVFKKEIHLESALYLGGMEKEKYCTAEVLVYERSENEMFCFQELLQRKMF